MLSITYLSSATARLDEQQLTELMAIVRPKNEALGITGVMLYADRSIIQTIEGPEEAVEATFARIADDSRHHDVFVALHEQIDERRFPDWSMGFRALTLDQARELPGFTDYLDAHRSRDAQEQKLSSPEIFHRVFRKGSGYSRP